MKLSKNFDLDEFTISQTAIRYDIDNTPNNEQIDNIILLTKEILQPLRDELGVIRISSGFRCKKLNAMIGGSVTSQHCKGQAADIQGKNNSLLFYHILEKLEFDQLIWEFGDDIQPAWVHTSFNKDGNRKQVLRAIREDNKTKYIEI